MVRIADKKHSDTINTREKSKSKYGITLFMKLRPLVFSLLFLLVIPFPILNISSGSVFAVKTPPFISELDFQTNTAELDSGRVFNNLVQERWKTPMALGKVKSELTSYDKRALISFFSYEERDQFEVRALENDIEVEKLYNNENKQKRCY